MLFFSKNLFISTEYGIVEKALTFFKIKFVILKLLIVLKRYCWTIQIWKITWYFIGKLLLKTNYLFQQWLKNRNLPYEYFEQKSNPKIYFSKHTLSLYCRYMKKFISNIWVRKYPDNAITVTNFLSKSSCEAFL